MTEATPASPAPQRASQAIGGGRRARHVDDPRVAAFVILIMLVLQYSLGMYANLFATLPESDRGKGIFAAFGGALPAARWPCPSTPSWEWS
jgi:hypothetical protein